MDPLTIINGSIEILKKISEAAKKIKDAEVKHLLADLSLQLADAKLAIADIKEEMAKLKEENNTLKAAADKEENPQIKDGCYFFGNDINRLFCPTCYDREGKKFLIAQILHTKKCNNCGGFFDAH